MAVAGGGWQGQRAVAGSRWGILLDGGLCGGNRLCRYIFCICRGLNYMVAWCF